MRQESEWHGGNICKKATVRKAWVRGWRRPRPMPLSGLRLSAPERGFPIDTPFVATKDGVGYAVHLAERFTPAVVLLEDFERMVQPEGVSLSHFLNLVLVIATCNEPDKLDPALIHRLSRFDRV